MAADDFAITPSWVTPAGPVYNNVISPSESQKKEYLNLSVTPVEEFALIFTLVSTTIRDQIKAHYNGRYGGYDKFQWQTVPSPIVASSSTMDGRWIDGSYKENYTGPAGWNIEVGFEKDNST